MPVGNFLRIVTFLGNFAWKGIYLAKKNLHDEQLKKGLETLRQSGLTVDSPSAQTMAQLKQFFGRADSTDLAVVFLLGKVFDESSLAALGELERASANKETKKEIKRALFKLAQKGLVAPEEPAETKSPAMVRPGCSDRSLHVCGRWRRRALDLDRQTAGGSWAASDSSDAP